MEETNRDTSTPEPEAAVSSLGFVDFPHPDARLRPFRWTVVMMAIPVLLMLLTLVVVLAMLPSPLNWIAEFCVVIPVVLLLLRELNRPPVAIQDVLVENRVESFETVLEHLFPKEAAPLVRHLRSIAIALVGERRFGQSCRLCLPQSAHAIIPVEKVFEALPLDESVGHFVELEAEQRRSGSEEIPHVSGVGTDEGELARRLKRNLAFSGGWVSVACFGYLLSTAAWEAWEAKRVTLHLVLWGFFFCTTILGMGGRGAWTSLVKWLLLPGAVIIEKTAWFRSIPTRVAFARPESVLFVHQSSRRTWTAHLAGANGAQTVLITEREATMFLRAWLSPVSAETTQRLIAAALS